MATKQGQFGTIEEINGGTAYSDPRDNPNFKGYVPPPTPQVTNTTTPAIPVDKVTETQPAIPSFTPPPQVPAVNTGINAAFATPPPEETKVTKEPDSMRSYVEQQMMKGQNRDIAAERAAFRAEANVAEKEKTARTLYNNMEARRMSYDRQIEELEKNKRGGFGGAMQAEINKLSRERSRELSELAIEYNVALGDYQGAEKVVNERISDMNAQIQNENQMWQTAFNFMQNDMTDSEKLQAQQAHDINMLGIQTEIENEQQRIANLQNEAAAAPYINSIQSGSLQIKDVPKELQSSVLSIMQERGIVDSQTKEKTNADIALTEDIFALINDPALGAATGPIGRWLPSWKTLTGETNDFAKAFNQVKSSLTVGNLGLMSGVLSETDVKILAEAATKLDRTQTKEAFIEEAKALHSLYVSKILEKPFVSVDQKKELLVDRILLDDPSKSDDEIQKEVDLLIKPYIPQTQAFNQAGNATASKLVEAIKSVESGGNYSAVGDAGTSKGAYQFQPATWKAYAGEILGNPNAPMTPANQDKVALGKVEKLLAQGYTPREVALIWNGGEPKEKKGYNAKIGLSYDSGAYANKVLSKLNA